jgi:hypothetical protein
MCLDHKTYPSYTRPKIHRNENVRQQMCRTNNKRQIAGVRCECINHCCDPLSLQFQNVSTFYGKRNLTFKISPKSFYLGNAPPFFVGS